MNILVSPEKTLGQISTEFNQKFPYLRIEFFGHTHQKGGLNAPSDRLNPDLTLREAGHVDHDETFSINGNLKVSTLEDQFQKLLNVGAQVMRKSGGLWLQTSTTDDWSLAMQNREGEFDSTAIGEM